MSAERHKLTALHPLTPVRDWRNDSDGELESETEWSAGGGGEADGAG